MNKQLGIFLLILCSQTGGALALHENDFGEDPALSMTSISLEVDEEPFCDCEEQRATVTQVPSGSGGLVINVNYGGKVVIYQEKVVRERTEKPKKAIKVKSKVPRQIGHRVKQSQDVLTATLIAQLRHRRTPQNKPSFAASGRSIPLCRRTIVRGPCN